MTAELEGGELSAARPYRTLPPGKTRYPFYRSSGGPQGRSGRAENLVPTGIRSRTVQPVAQSLYRLSYSAHIYPCTPHEILFGLSNLEELDGREMWRVWETGEVPTGFWWEQERDHLETLGIEGRITSKSFFRKCNGDAWTELIWLRIGTGGGRL